MYMVKHYLVALHRQACMLQVVAQAMHRVNAEENVQLSKQLQVSSLALAANTAYTEKLPCS